MSYWWTSRYFWTFKNWQQCNLAGGSGVIKDIPDNSKVMGYPAKNLKTFITRKQVIHKTAIINRNAKIASTVDIGPYTIIGPNVEIGDNTVIQSHVSITGHTIIGKDNKVYPFASIGNDPQDMKYKGERTKLLIGDNNTIREYTTINPGTTNVVENKRRIEVII